MGALCYKPKPLNSQNPNKFSSIGITTSQNTEEDQARIQINKINLYIDAYNREVESLNNNIIVLKKRAIECKRENQDQLALFYLHKKKHLQEKASKLSSNSILLLDRKNKIEQMEQDREFSGVMKETNDLLSKYMNENVIDEIHRMNDIERELRYRDKDVEDMAFSDDLVKEFENLGVESLFVDTNMPPAPLQRISHSKIGNNALYL